ncbi:hypothetical protein ACFL47_04755 [Candidatus Latescibacterota bacterium]
MDNRPLDLDEGDLSDLQIDTSATTTTTGGVGLLFRKSRGYST